MDKWIAAALDRIASLTFVIGWTAAAVWAVVHFGRISTSELPRWIEPVAGLVAAAGFVACLAALVSAAAKRALDDWLADKPKRDNKRKAEQNKAESRKRLLNDLRFLNKDQVDTVYHALLSPMGRIPFVQSQKDEDLRRMGYLIHDPSKLMQAVDASLLDDLDASQAAVRARLKELGVRDDQLDSYKY